MLPYIQTASVVVEQKTGCGKKILYGVLVIFGLGVLGNILGAPPSDGDSPSKQSVSENKSQSVPAPSVEPSPVPSSAPSPVPSVEPSVVATSFNGSCGISASAHLRSDDFINHPYLRISVKNISGKDIAAIQFYAVPYDVYGKDISSSIFSQKKLHTDDLIAAGSSEQLNYGPFLDQKMKSVKLYVYSVYYADGSEWGDKDATRSEILKYGKQIEATFEK